jgi:hypothetical protein
MSFYRGLTLFSKLTILQILNNINAKLELTNTPEWFMDVIHCLSHFITLNYIMFYIFYVDVNRKMNI